jgi:hypothetical protein
MNEAQVEVMATVVTVQPVMASWWVNYIKAWCKADGKTAEECEAE